ncbi:MAG: efflux RND transporter periplasmic adaptor subunit [bacterium]|nr:efflux RND transporter periplasmic adaptor subunit [bacterium]
MSLIKKVFVYGVVLGVIALLFYGARLYAENSRREQSKAQEAAPPGGDARNAEAVKICRVFPVPLTDVLKLPGTVEAFDDIDLATRIPGTVEWVGPREGDRIAKGQRLLQLDVAGAQAQAARARTAHELAQIKLKRLGELRQNNIIAPEMYDNAEADLKTCKAALDEAEVNLRYGTLLSPIDGVLERRYADPGEHVDAGKSVMRIVHIDKVKVMLNVPEKDVLHFQRGQAADLVFDNGQPHAFKGAIDWIAMAADPATRTYSMKILVDNPDHLLRPGMIVDARLVRRRIAQAVVVPFFTIIDREDGKAVYVVERGVARERPIDYGIFQGGTVEITRGLKAGDQLIVVGQRNLVDGQPVQVAQDVTEQARQFMTNGGDLSKLILDLNH